MLICCNIHVICDSIANNPIKSIAILCNRIVILNRLVGELVATKALPKPASEKTLQRKYKILATATKGRIDIDTDSGQKLSELVHMYCAAFTNLYGTEKENDEKLNTMKYLYKYYCSTTCNDLSKITNSYIRDAINLAFLHS